MQPFEDSAVQSDWIINMLAAEKIGSEESESRGCQGSQNPRIVLRTVDQQAREASALALSAHVQAVGALLKLQQRPFKHVPAVAEWLRSYDVLKAR